MKINFRNSSQMQTTLLDPVVTKAFWTYLMIRGLPWLSKRDQRCDLTLLRGRPLGREFNKTFGHCHLHHEPETYQVFLGRALFMIQKMDSQGLATEIKIVKARVGDRVSISGESYHNTINLGRGPLIIVNWLNRETTNDYRLIEEKHGFGYYVLQSPSQEFELVPNPNYGKVPEPIVLDD